MGKLRSAILVFGSAGVFAAAAAGAALRPGDAVPGAGAPSGEVVPSDAPGALDTPNRWECPRILPEYRAWLEAGNATTDWKYYGISYRNVETGELYDWADWLRWAREAKCSVGPYVESEFAQFLAIPVANGILGGVIAAAGAGGLLASRNNADSPG